MVLKRSLFWVVCLADASLVAFDVRLKPGKVPLRLRCRSCGNESVSESAVWNSELHSWAVSRGGYGPFVCVNCGHVGEAGVERID